MTRLLFVLITFSLTSLVLADEHYMCYDLEISQLQKEVPMKISTSFFSNKINSINLITKIKTRDINAVENPFTSLGISTDEIDPYAISEASQLNFKGITNEVRETKNTIVVSDSILRFEETGYAHYHSKVCFWILECTETYKYFKCEKI